MLMGAPPDAEFFSVTENGGRHPRNPELAAQRLQASRKLPQRPRVRLGRGLRRSSEERGPSEKQQEVTQDPEPTSYRIAAAIIAASSAVTGTGMP